MAPPASAPICLEKGQSILIPTDFDRQAISGDGMPLAASIKMAGVNVPTILTYAWAS